MKIVQSIVVCVLLAGCAGGSFSPQPGAEFSGTIDVSQQKARTGKVTFSISEDGTKISDITLQLLNVQCGTVTIGLVNLNVAVNSPIDGKRFTIENDYFGQISGSFHSATTAGGDINIILGKNVGSTHDACDLGTYLWAASVEPD